MSLLRRDLLHLYAKNGKKFYFTGLNGRDVQDGRRIPPKYTKKWAAVLGSNCPPLWACVLRSLPQWWDASQSAAALLHDPLTTPEMWYEDFMQIFPHIPLHGYGHWPKFLFQDIGMHLAPKGWPRPARSAERVGRGVPPPPSGPAPRGHGGGARGHRHCV